MRQGAVHYPETLNTYDNVELSKMTVSDSSSHAPISQQDLETRFNQIRTEETRSGNRSAGRRSRRCTKTNICATLIPLLFGSALVGGVLFAMPGTLDAKERAEKSSTQAVTEAASQTSQIGAIHGAAHERLGTNLTQTPGGSHSSQSIVVTPSPTPTVMQTAEELAELVSRSLQTDEDETGTPAPDLHTVLARFRDAGVPDDKARWMMNEVLKSVDSEAETTDAGEATTLATAAAATTLATSYRR